jgi:hypothetical protein
VLLGISIKPLFLAFRKKIAAKQVANTFISPFPPVHTHLQTSNKKTGKDEPDHCSCCK